MYIIYVNTYLLATPPAVHDSIIATSIVPYETERFNSCTVVVIFKS